MNLGAVTTLIFDLDGVVWRGDAPIESAVSAIHDLRAAGKRCLFCTNNSGQTQAAFVAKLAAIGIPGVVEDEVITSSSATALYLSAQYTGPFLAYVIGGEGIHLALQKIGARIVPDIDIDNDTNVDCVVAGIDRTFTYEKLRVAQRLINRGALFIATNRDATFPVENGGVVPGAGSIIAAIETASGSTPVTIGKPRPVMVQLVMQKYDLKPEQIAVIGDRLDTDIVCARRAGVAAFLVTTGVTTLDQARRAKGELRPDAVFPNLGTFAEMVLDNSPAAPLQTDELPTALHESTPESAPALETVAVPALADLPAELPEQPAEEPVEEVAAPADSPFSFDSLTLDEPEVKIETEPVAMDEEPAETIAADPAAAEPARLEGWDDSWFEEESAEAPAAETQPAGSEVIPAESTGAENNGFNWKLD